MEIKIPRRLVALAMRFEAWANEPLYGRVLRVDALVAVCAIPSIAFGYWQDGWIGALLGGLTYTFVVICALRPR